MLLNLDLALEEDELLVLMAEVDANDNGVVDLSEFLPLAAELIVALRSRSAARRKMQFCDEFLRELAEEDLEEIASLIQSNLQTKDPENM